MINFEIKQDSVRGVTDYVQGLKDQILANIRLGMKEAMVGLANHVAGKVPVRTGGLLAAILRSPKVTETTKVIRGTVSGDVGKKHKGLWIEEGISVPAVAGKLMVFAAPDGTMVFTRKHRAFSIAGKPFMNPSLEEYKQQIVDTIAARLGGSGPSRSGVK